MSNNLDLKQVSPTEGQKEVHINDRMAQLDAALTADLAISLASANGTVTAAQFIRYIKFTCSGNTIARDLTLPAIERGMFVVQNDGTATITVKVGATSISLPAGEKHFFGTDGTTDGLVRYTDSIPTSFKYDFKRFFKGAPANDEVIFRYVVLRPFLLPVNLSGSYFLAITASTGTAVFTINRNGAPIGTVTFTTSATGVCAVAFSTRFEVGDVFDITAPSSADATLAGLSFFIKTDTAPATALLMQQIRVPLTGLFSLSRLNANYGGFCFKVRRSTDDTELDIGFDADGEHDIPALEAFCSSGDGFVSIWYDQSGNSNHIAMTTLNRQPKIVTAGVALEELTSGTNTGLSKSTAGTYNTWFNTLSRSMAFLFKPTVIATTGATTKNMFGDGSLWTGVALRNQVGDANVHFVNMWYTGQTGGTQFSGDQSWSGALGVPMLFMAKHKDGVGIHSYLNDNAEVLNAVATNPHSGGMSSTPLFMWNGNGQYLEGTMREAILSKEAMDINDLNAIGAYMSTKHGVAWTPLEA